MNILQVQRYEKKQKYFASFKNLRTFAPDFERMKLQKNTSETSELLLRFRENEVAKEHE